MKIKTARYSKTFPISAYGVNDRFEMECEIEEGEDQKTARKELVKEVREWCKESNANQKEVIIPGIVPEIQLRDIQALERIEDFYNEYSGQISAAEREIFKRVIKNKEVSSYQKLITIIDGVDAAKKLTDVKRTNKKRKL